ncbi:MAG: hypothetical protein ABSG80_04610 [Verrucomicrobiota bacterium]|jgi:hypothetical protein
MSSEFRRQASLVLNVVLAVTVVVLVLHKSERAPAPSAREVSPGKMTNETPVFTNQPKLPRYTDIASASDRRRWLIDQLRAAGVPNNVLARVVLSDREEDWERHFEEFHGDADKMAAMQLEYDMGKDAEMRAALGEEGFKLWDQGNMLREANIGKIQLTASETNALYDLKKKLQQRHLDLEQARLNGEMDDAEVNDEESKAYSEYNQQTKALLGDERYAKSQGIDDGTAATNLQQELAKVNPSDSQFQDLLKAQQQLNESRSQLDKQFQDDPSSPDYAEQIKALDAARDQEYQRVLGTNAFDTLQKAQDDGYSKMKKYENTWGLDDNKIDYVYDALKYYQKSVQDYQAQAKALEAQGQSVDWDAVNKNLQQFADQTQQALQNSLGQDSFNKMQRNGVFQFSPPQELTGHSPPSQ